MVDASLTAVADTDATIAAIATPPGIGGIAVVRVSGSRAIEIADRVWDGPALSQRASHTACFGSIVDKMERETVDEAVATVFRAPRSFTGEDTVEFSIHGSRYAQQRTLELLIAAGARMAEPGEFTRRAYLSGRFDLVQVEAVADLIAARTRAQGRLAMSTMRGRLSEVIDTLRQQLTDFAVLLELELDFSEEDVEFVSRKDLLERAQALLKEVERLGETYRTGQAIVEGIPTAIIGAPNVGKSSILNRLVNRERAIVSDIPGTTRDLIEDTLVVDDLMLRLIDSAGLRSTDDPVESIGIDRARRAASDAAIVLHISDATAPGNLTDDLLPPDLEAEVISVVNKADLLADESYEPNALQVSAKTGQGFNRLLKAISDAAHRIAPVGSDDAVVTNARQAAALRDAAADLQRVIDGLHNGVTTDLVAQDLRHALANLATLTGQIATPDLLATLFSRFCIGK